MGRGCSAPPGPLRSWVGCLGRAPCLAKVVSPLSRPPARPAPCLANVVFSRPPALPPRPTRFGAFLAGDSSYKETALKRGCSASSRGKALPTRFVQASSRIILARATSMQDKELRAHTARQWSAAGVQLHGLMICWLRMGQKRSAIAFHEHPRFYPLNLNCMRQIFISLERVYGFHGSLAA